MYFPWYFYQFTCWLLCFYDEGSVQVRNVAVLGDYNVE